MRRAKTHGMVAGSVSAIYLPLFFMSGLQPVAPQDADAFFFFVGACSRSFPASTAGSSRAVPFRSGVRAVPSSSGMRAFAAGALDAVGSAALDGVGLGALTFASGTGAADSVLLHPAVAELTERIASTVEMVSNESDLGIDGS